MKNLIRLNDYSKNKIFEVFKTADDVKKGKYSDFLKGKTIIMFFPNSSIRTRLIFEKGIYLLGGQTVLFPSETLDKKEKICDVIGYLNNWADTVIVRHKNISMLDEISKYSTVPVINAMTDINHPCEVLSDLYSLSKIRSDYLELKYLFVGTKGNIALAWKEAADLMKFEFTQCCPKGYEINGIDFEVDLFEAINNKDIVLTDSLNQTTLVDFKNYHITKDVMNRANKNALLNPCPPFYRGEEVSDDAIDSDFFVGYNFKKSLLELQQAIIIYNMM